MSDGYVSEYIQDIGAEIRHSFAGGAMWYLYGTIGSPVPAKVIETRAGIAHSQLVSNVHIQRA